MLRVAKPCPEDLQGRAFSARWVLYGAVIMFRTGQLFVQSGRVDHPERFLPVWQGWEGNLCELLVACERHAKLRFGVIGLPFHSLWGPATCVSLYLQRKLLAKYGSFAFFELRAGAMLSSSHPREPGELLAT